MADVSAQRLEEACGADPGWFCRQALELTGDRTVAEAADFVIGKPLTILCIGVVAVVVNRIGRRAVKRFQALDMERAGARQWTNSHEGVLDRGRGLSSGG